MAAFTDFALFYETAGINQVTPFDFMLVGLGGGLGSLLRWWIGRLVGERYHGNFPLGTFLINVSGAFDGLSLRPL